jgi:hypothetical protein
MALGSLTLALLGNRWHSAKDDGVARMRQTVQMTRENRETVQSQGALRRD